MMSDIVERLRAWARDMQTGRDCFGADQDLQEAANYIEELRAALALADAALSGANMNMRVVEKKIRAALGESI